MLNPLSVLRRKQDAIRARSAVASPQPGRGEERRLSGVLPFEENLFGRKVIRAKHIKWRQLFYSIQANRITCSLWVSSDRLKARGTLITLDGKGLVCIFRKRGQNAMITGERAFSELLMTIKEPDCAFNLAFITPEIAHGMAAMSFGHLSSHPVGNAGAEFRKEVEALERQRGTGCVQVLNGLEEVIVSAFIHNGEMQCFASYEKNKNRNDRNLGPLIRKCGGGSTLRSWILDSLEALDSVTFELTSIRLDDVSRSSIQGKFDSTEQYLSQFYEKPNLRETFMSDNVSPREKHEQDIHYVSEIAIRRSVTTFSHMINPLLGGGE